MSSSTRSGICRLTLARRRKLQDRSVIGVGLACGVPPACHRGPIIPREGGIMQLPRTELGSVHGQWPSRRLGRQCRLHLWINFIVPELFTRNACLSCGDVCRLVMLFNCAGFVKVLS